MKTRIAAVALLTVFASGVVAAQAMRNVPRISIDDVKALMAKKQVVLIDVRAAKTVRLAGDRRVGAFVEVFNALNANPEQNVSWSSGAAFLRPLDIVSPRIVRVGVTVDW